MRTKRAKAVIGAISLLFVFILTLGSFYLNEVRSRLLIAEIVANQVDASITQFYFTGRLTQDQQELLYLLSKEPSIRRYFIRKMKELRHGNISEQRAAAALSMHFARRDPDKDVVDVFDYYLSQQTAFDSLVAAEMALTIADYDYSLLERNSQLRRLDQFESALASWNLNTSAILSTVESAKELFDEQ